MIGRTFFPADKGAVHPSSGSNYFKVKRLSWAGRRERRDCSITYEDKVASSCRRAIFIVPRSTPAVHGTYVKAITLARCVYPVSSASHGCRCWSSDVTEVDLFAEKCNWCQWRTFFIFAHGAYDPIPLAISSAMAMSSKWNRMDATVPHYTDTLFSLYFYYNASVNYELHSELMIPTAVSQS